MPTQPCSGCGNPVIYELYRLDAISYEKGVIVRHQCRVYPPPPLNERDFCPKCYQVKAWGCECSVDPPPKTMPAPKKPAPVKKPNNFVGGIPL